MVAALYTVANTVLLGSRVVSVDCSSHARQWRRVQFAEQIMHIGCNAVEMEVGVDLAEARRLDVSRSKLRLWEKYSAFEVLRLRTGTSAEDYLINATAPAPRLK
jgi:hypothetical protein